MLNSQRKLYLLSFNAYNLFARIKVYCRTLRAPSASLALRSTVTRVTFASFYCHEKEVRTIIE